MLIESSGIGFQKIKLCLAQCSSDSGKFGSKLIFDWTLQEINIIMYNDEGVHVKLP